MNPYHKIQSIFKRHPTTKKIIEGEYSLPEFEYLAGNPWTFSEKVDGTNTRIQLVDGAVCFTGRSDEAQMPPKLLNRLRERFYPALDQLAAMFPNGACLYGEGYGAKIQKGGGNYRPDQDFVLFDVRVGDFWLKRADVEDVAQKLGLDVVPIIGIGTLHLAVEMARAGFQSTWGDFQAEGIVARPLVELHARNGDRIITKIKHRDFA